MPDDKLTADQQDALDEFRKEKDNPESVSAFFYGMLKGADPHLIEFMERKAGIMIHGGRMIGRELASAERDPKKKAEIQRKMQDLASKLNSTAYNAERGKKEEGKE